MVNVVNITDINDGLESLKEADPTSHYYWDGYEIVKWTPDKSGEWHQDGVRLNDTWGITTRINYNNTWKGWTFQF